MTRMQKWQSYRDEIAQQAKISTDIAADEERRIKYKTEIDKINSAILSSSLDQPVSLEKGVSLIEGERTQISIDIAKMFNTISKAANIINKESIDSIFFDMKKERLVINNNFVEDKLLQDKTYSEFKQNIANHGLDNSEKKEIENQLKDKYKNLSSKKEDYAVKPVISIDKNSEKQASHYVFIISISVSIFLLVILVSLFITKAVLR